MQGRSVILLFACIVSAVLGFSGILGQGGWLTYGPSGIFLVLFLASLFAGAAAARRGAAQEEKRLRETGRAPQARL